MIVEVFEGLAEPSDLFPYAAGTTTFDITAVGSVKILRWLNRAYKRIVNWKMPDGSQARFPCQDGEFFFKSVVKNGTVVAASSSDITFDASLDAVVDQYNGWIVEITAGLGVGQKRLLTSFSIGRLSSISVDWDVIPDTTSSYSVYKRFYKFVPSSAGDVSENIALSPINQIAAVRKLSDVSGLFDLAKGGGNETYIDGLFSSGTPSSYIVQNNRIIFDLAVDEVRWYRLEYARIPPALVAATDEPELPDSFNEVLILFAQWIGLKRAQEWTGAYTNKKDIEDLMRSLKSSLEMSFEREDIGAFY